MAWKTNTRGSEGAANDLIGIVTIVNELFRLDLQATLKKSPFLFSTMKKFFAGLCSISENGFVSLS